MSLQTKFITLLPGVIAGLVPGLTIAFGIWLNGFMKRLGKKDFIRIDGPNTSVIINGQNYQGHSIYISDGKVKVDGKSMKSYTDKNHPQLYVYNVQITGNPQHVTTKGDVIVNGNCALVQTCGKVRVNGKTERIIMTDSDESNSPIPSFPQANDSQSYGG